MKVIIKGKEYIYDNEIRNNAHIRHSFNELAKKVHGIDFEGWYEKGFWGDDYIPYVLMDGHTVAANVSANIIHAKHRNEERLFIQIGTVMTDERYRKQGLSRWLIEKVLEEWEGRCDGFYLYANNTVLDFYPKSGFVKGREYQACGTASPRKAEMRKMDMASESDRKLLYEKYALSNPFSALTVERNTGLLMFYCAQFMKDDVYYLPQYDLAVVAQYYRDKLKCCDIFGSTDAALQEILSVMAKENTHEVVLGFTPKDKGDFSFKEAKEENNTLFWRSKKENIFCNDTRLRFPLLSHA